MAEVSAAEWIRKSWIDSANGAESGFPLQSLPYCIFTEGNARPRPGVGIGAFIIDLQRLSRGGLLEGLPDAVRKSCESPTLNALMACGSAAHAALRIRLMALLDADADDATRDAVGVAMIPVEAATLLKPVEPPNYTDFYASIQHARRVGELFRPDNPLLPNYSFVPIGYHGRASSIVVSGTDVRRPHGQTRPVAGDEGQLGVPSFGPTKSLDYEVEIGMYIADGNPMGEPIGIGDTGRRVFGISLLNDWSARDIQAWEYQPLGPFLGKSFATSVSPWVVPKAALEPFRAPAAQRLSEEALPLQYLFDECDQTFGAIDLTVEVWLQTATMRAEGQSGFRLSSANLKDLWWTPAQLIAHHASNGCNLLSGDLLATGTISGSGVGSEGCLLELTTGGRKPVTLPNGESRAALADGDEVILRGFCKRDGFPTVSLGECRGRVAPAHSTV